MLHKKTGENAVWFSLKIDKFMQTMTAKYLNI